MTDTPKRVLVVDDEEVLRTMVQSVLELDGYVVETAGSGEEALSRLQSGGFDLLVTDNNMPGLQGLDVLERVRALQPDLPVIIMTAFGAMEVSMRAHELGAAGFLLKPFDDIADITAEVRKVLTRAERKRRLDR